MSHLLLRSAAVRRFIQPANCLRTLTTEAHSSETPTETKETTAQSRPPFLVSRTSSGNFPVYHLAKRGGNYKLTVIKKIEGNKQALRQSLVEELGLDDALVKVLVPTGHIEVKVGLELRFGSYT